jgi:hypothetical protein
MWGGGFQAKRQAAMDKINSHFDETYKKMHEDRAMYGTSWSKDGERIDPMSVYLEEPAQEPVTLPCCECTNASAVKWNPFNGVVQCHMCGQIYTASLAAQPAQEPVAWMYDWLCDGKLITGWIAHNEAEIPKLVASNIRPLYTTPPKREWVGLTDEDRKAVLLTAYKEWECEELLLCAREDYLLIEQALKEKNT